MRQFVVFALFAIFASSFAAESQPAAPAAPAAVSSSHSLYDNMKAIPQLSKTMAIIDLPELSIVKNLLKGTEAVKANETKSGEKHTAEALPLWSLFAAADAPKNKTLPTHEGIKAPFRTAKAPFTLFAPNNDAWDRFVAVHAAAKQKKATVLKGNETGAATTTNTTSSSSSQASATGASTTSGSQAEQKQEGGQQQQQQQQQGGTEQWSAEDKKLLIAALQYHIVNSVNLSLASLANEGDNFKLFMPTLLNNADFVLLNGESQVLVLEKMGGKFMLFDGFAANQTQPIKSNVTASQQQQQQAGGASNATTSGAGSQAAVSEPAGSNATSRGTSKVLEGTSLTISRIMNAPAADLAKLAPSLAAIEYANVVQQDVVSSNGVLQVIDKILLVPTTLSSNLEHARLNKLFKVLNDWKFIEKLDNMTDVTVFAPADEALASLPDIGEKDREKYIMAHVVQGARYTSNFTSGQQQQQQQSSTTAEQTQTQTQASSLKSLANSTISVSEADKKLFFNKDSSNAQLLIGDIILKNGVMHIISKPLFATNQTAQR